MSHDSTRRSFLKTCGAAAMAAGTGPLTPQQRAAAAAAPKPPPTASAVDPRTLPVPQVHYRPADGWFGDAMPFYWQGVYHVFYLKRQGSNGPILWEHIASRDLVHWRELPAPFPPGKAGSTDSYLLTGSIIERNGVFHAYYGGGGPKGTTICHATSRDLTTWTKDPANPVVVLDPKYYEAPHWRDAHVFWNPEAKVYWMAICAREHTDGVHPYTGCLALAVSPDLERWEVRPPLWRQHMSTAVECPDIFPFGKGWALVYFFHCTNIRLSDSPSGPWRRPPMDPPDSYDLHAGKTMSDGKRHILVGWLPRRDCDCARRTWAGTMLAPRELYLLPDGAVATRCVPELTAACSADATGGRGATVFKPSLSRWTIGAQSARAELAVGEAGLACWVQAPADYYFRTDLRLPPGSSAAIILRGQPAGEDEHPKPTPPTPLDTGYVVWIDPVLGTVSLREWYGWDQRNAIVEIPYRFPKNEPVRVEMFVDGDVLEVFVGERRSLVSRLLLHPAGSLALIAQDGPVAFENMHLGQLP